MTRPWVALGRNIANWKFLACFLICKVFVGFRKFSSLGKFLTPLFGVTLLFFLNLTKYVVWNLFAK